MSASFWIYKRNLLKAVGINRFTIKRMCLTYFYQSEIRPTDGYWFILANNRDEHWDRPTKTLDFWGEEGNCLSGQDDQPGKNGGTWLGMNRQGKIAVLLNILGQFQHDKRGRGHLINDYLLNNEDIHSYAKTVENNRYDYNGFNLVLFDLGHGINSFTHKPVYITNGLRYSSTLPMRTLPANMFHALSNSPMEYPFQKAEKGKEKFREIVTEHGLLVRKEHLISSIISLLEDKTCLLPDPILERAAAPVGYSPTRAGQQSAINVHSPQERYGTTISSVILVDGKGQVDYYEKTRDFVADENSPPVSIHRKNFNLCFPDQNENSL